MQATGRPLDRLRQRSIADYAHGRRRLRFEVPDEDNCVLTLPGLGTHWFWGLVSTSVVGKEVVMSVPEPATTSESNGRARLPNFPVVMRGYDRQQVQAFVQDLASRLGMERRRADETERALAQMRLEMTAAQNQPPPSFEHLGSEAARVLEQAGKSAKLLIQEAKSRGEALVREAEVEAAELIEKAEQHGAELDRVAAATLNEATGERDRILAAVAAEADELRTRAEEEARTALAEAHEESERIRQQVVDEQSLMSAQTERLRQSRGQMLDYLGRIHADLGVLLAEAVEVPSQVAPPPEDGTLIEAELDGWAMHEERASDLEAERAALESDEASAGKKR